MIDAKLAAALVRARGNITNPERDKVGLFANHKYAALENILDEVQPHLQAEGIVLMQDIDTIGGGLAIVAVNLFIHESGATMRTRGPAIPVPNQKKPGDAGAAATYAKRYALLAALGIEADADQDVKNLQKAPSDPRRAPGVDESGLSDTEVLKKYGAQIKWINDAAKAKDEMEFVKHMSRIPQEDRVAVFGAIASYSRTYSKQDGVKQSLAEATAMLQRDVFDNEEAVI